MKCPKCGTEMVKAKKADVWLCEKCGTRCRVEVDTPETASELEDHELYLGERYGDRTLFAMYSKSQSGGDLSFRASHDAGSERGTIVVFCPAEVQEKVSKLVRSWWKQIEVSESRSFFAGREVPMCSMRVEFPVVHAGEATRRLIDLISAAAMGTL